MDDREMLEVLVAAMAQGCVLDDSKRSSSDHLKRVYASAQDWLETAPPSHAKNRVASHIFEAGQQPPDGTDDLLVASLTDDTPSKRIFHVGDLSVTLEGPPELTAGAEPTLYYDATEDGLLARKIVDYLGGNPAFELRTENELRTANASLSIVVRGPLDLYDQPTTAEVYERWARRPIIETDDIPGKPR